MDLNGGAVNNNASNARILTQFILANPKLPSLLPSIAEALAVLASSTLIVGALQTPYRHYWEYDKTTLTPGQPQAFNASISSQQYTSGHINDWQSIFYVVLFLVLIINAFCLGYFMIRSGLVTDFTEPQNTFALAVNSPPSAQLAGSCGGGPGPRELVIPWKVSWAGKENHYFFEEANDRPWRGKFSRQGPSSATEVKDLKGSSYKRLSSSRGWL
jgi:hypothetical protein